VLVHRAGADAEDVADVPVGLALGQPCQHFALALGQLVGPVQRGVAAGLDDALVQEQDVLTGHLRRRQPQPQFAVSHPDGAFAAGLGGDEAVDPLAQLARQAINASVLLQVLGQPGARPGRSPGYPAAAVEDDDGPGGGVHGVHRGRHHARRAQVGVQPRQHDVGIDGLGHVVDAARLETPHHVFRLGQSRHEDDGHVRGAVVLLEPPAGLEPVHAGHDGIHQDDVGQDIVHALDGRRSVRGHDDHVAGAVQRRRQHLQVVRHIVDQQDELVFNRASSHGVHVVLSGGCCIQSGGIP
jgi:hypothetical protein